MSASTSSGPPPNTQEDDAAPFIWPRAPLLSRLRIGATIGTIQVLNKLVLGLASLFINRPEILPTHVYNYPCRPGLPVRVFLPKSYKEGTAEGERKLLPTIFAIHGGGFCLGAVEHDDEVNTALANMHNVLVVALNYRKAPYHPYPVAIHDVEALLLAVFATAEDETHQSLPIDKSRVALMGYSAGGSLALAVSQLPSVRERVRPAAVIPLYASTDYSVDIAAKAVTRYYKPALGSGVRSRPSDQSSMLSHLFKWSYVPVGQDLRDPLLSPIFAPRELLPPHLFFIYAELDQLGNEGWRMACKMAGREHVPSAEDKVGQESPAAGEPGALILGGDERFAFESSSPDGSTSVKWLLIPDQIHAFDHLPPELHGSEDATQDAKAKTAAYQKVVGEWLHHKVWKAGISVDV